MCVCSDRRQRVARPAVIGLFVTRVPGRVAYRVPWYRQQAYAWRIDWNVGSGSTDSWQRRWWQWNELNDHRNIVTLRRPSTGKHSLQLSTLSFGKTEPNVFVTSSTKTHLILIKFGIASDNSDVWLCLQYLYIGSISLSWIAYTVVVVD